MSTSFLFFAFLIISLFNHCHGTDTADTDEPKPKYMRDPDNWYGDKNCYEILKIAEDAGWTEVKREYGFKKRRGVKPKQAFKKLKGCYEILSNPAKRSLYHQSGFDYEYAKDPSVPQYIKYSMLNKVRSFFGPNGDKILSLFGLALPNPIPKSPAPKEEI